jgi:hypothetical protein
LYRCAITAQSLYLAMQSTVASQSLRNHCTIALYRHAIHSRIAIAAQSLHNRFVSLRNPQSHRNRCAITAQSLCVAKQSTVASQSLRNHCTIALYRYAVTTQSLNNRTATLC